MREIKFRAWDKSAKRMYHVADMSFGLEGCLIVRTTDGNVFTGLKNAKEYELMQYTGLKDKNGKEGYEADILDIPVGRAVIRFGEYSSPSGIEKHIGFYIEFTDGNYADLYRKDIGYWMPLSEIIGNIHDNPELLKEVE